MAQQLCGVTRAIKTCQGLLNGAQQVCSVLVEILELLQGRAIDNAIEYIGKSLKISRLIPLIS